MGKRELPGRSWRFLAHYNPGGGSIALDSKNYGGPTEFDELVVGDWLHVEQMDTRVWWCRFGPVTLNISIRADGTHDLIIEDTASGELLARYEKGKRVE